jgi:hypothetical protein
MSAPAARQPVPKDAILWRRIWPMPEWVVWREDGTCRPTSNAFRDDRHELSVHQAHLTTEDEALARWPEHGLVAFPAEAVRAMGYKVYADPEPDDPSHAVVVPRMTPAHRKQLTKIATWVKMPG